MKDDLKKHINICGKENINGRQREKNKKKKGMKDMGKIISTD